MVRYRDISRKIAILPSRSMNPNRSNAVVGTEWDKAKRRESTRSRGYSETSVIRPKNANR